MADRISRQEIARGGRARALEEKMDYEVDSEVGVSVFAGPSDDDDDVVSCKITALSTEHDIDYLIVWNRHGKGRKYDGLENEADKITKGIRLVDCQKVTKELHLAPSSFPICIEVYEKADGKEPADGHRHGWFGADGHPRSDKEHEVDSEKLGIFYPKMPGTFTRGIDGEGPVYQPHWR
jgi:hypothetical protein